MNVSIFYSWQSDLPGKTNRNFIEDAIKKSLKGINKDNRIIACIDRDTKDELGSPDIRASIFNKLITANSLFAMFHKTKTAFPIPMF